MYYAEDDENMVSSSSKQKAQDNASSNSIYLKKDKHLRYRTRLFVAEYVTAHSLLTSEYAKFKSLQCFLVKDFVFHITASISRLVNIIDLNHTMDSFF